MRLPEQKAWDGLKRHAEGVLKLKRIENAVGQAMADIIGENRSGTAFWLEMKAITVWPVRATTFPLKGKFQPGQLSWGRDWKSWKGHSFVMLKVQQEWLLLDPDHDLHLMTKEELIKDACFAKGMVGILIHLQGLK